MTDVQTPTPQELHTVFRARRREMVTSPQGQLALTVTHWFYGAPGETESVWGVPGLWAALPDGEQGLSLTASPSDAIVVDGSLVDDTVVVRAKDSGAPSAITLSETRSATVIVGDDGKYALRVWDSVSEAIQNFGEIDTFDYNPDWVITGTFTPVEGGRSVEVEHIKDAGATRDKVVPGDITFSHEGVDYHPAAFVEGRALMMVFADATNGDTTYGVGRFLMCAPNPDGTITLDFNRAFLPPCAFSHNFNCPMPPAQNRFPFAVNAGEKNVLNSAGELLH